MRVLVTGSTGLVGYSIVERLSVEHEVVGVSRGSDGSTEARKHVSADIAHPHASSKIDAATERCDAIVHTAASLAPQSPATVLTNCLGTFEVVHLAELWNVRHLIFMSSVPIVGAPDPLPVEESHPVDPTNPYFATKAFGEHLVRMAAGKGLRTTTLRLTAPIGPKMPRQRILAAFVRQALDGKPLAVAGQGTRRQDYVHVDDVAEAVAVALREGCAGLFNIARGESISNKDLAQRCVDLLRSSSEVVLGEQPDPQDGLAWEVSISAARQAFGYEPRHGIDDMIVELAESMG